MVTPLSIPSSGLFMILFNCWCLINSALIDENASIYRSIGCFGSSYSSGFWFIISIERLFISIMYLLLLLNYNYNIINCVNIYNILKLKVGILIIKFYYYNWNP